MNRRDFALILASLSLGLPLMAQPATVDDLEERVYAAIRPTDYDDSKPHPSFEERIRALGDPVSVGRVFLQIVEKNRSAKPGEVPGYLHLVASIAALEILGTKNSLPILSDIAVDPAMSAWSRSRAIAALGTIDVSGSASSILSTLDASGPESYMIRGAAAEALAKSSQIGIAEKLEAQVSREQNPDIRAKLRQGAEAIRGRVRSRELP